MRVYRLLTRKYLESLKPNKSESIMVN